MTSTAEAEAAYEKAKNALDKLRLAYTQGMAVGGKARVALDRARDVLDRRWAAEDKARDTARAARDRKRAIRDKERATYMQARKALGPHNPLCLCTGPTPAPACPIHGSARQT